MLTSLIRQSPAESTVNAGAVYISSTGPNPIMPFPVQTNSMFGCHNTPIGSPPFGPLGVPRHINVHIHAGVGPRGTNVDTNQGGHANETSNAPAAAVGVNVQARVADDSTMSENPASQCHSILSKREREREMKIIAAIFVVVLLVVSELLLRLSFSHTRFWIRQWRWWCLLGDYKCFNSIVLSTLES